ncbi:MAG: hypothetical protein HY815_31375 [Candidatus Riflebacteria bacterium]|nr:hypothetical protein [Candidatus Riflebacteria bacterium]
MDTSSANFTFLGQNHQVLADLGTFAEKWFAEDSNTGHLIAVPTRITGGSKRIVAGPRIGYSPGLVVPSDRTASRRSRR